MLEFFVVHLVFFALAALCGYQILLAFADLIWAFRARHFTGCTEAEVVKTRRLFRRPPIYAYEVYGVSHRGTLRMGSSWDVELGTRKKILFDERLPKQFCLADAGDCRRSAFVYLLVQTAAIVLAFWSLDLGKYLL